MRIMYLKKQEEKRRGDVTDDTKLRNDNLLGSYSRTADSAYYWEGDVTAGEVLRMRKYPPNEGLSKREGLMLQLWQMA